MIRSAPILLAALTLTASVAGGAETGTGQAVAIELFTSQGCSSCLPADEVLAKLAREPGVVAISRPVTYWDQLGWKDTLARQQNTALQRAYAARLGAGVYTPEAVVQGNAGVVGGEEANLRRLIGAARARPMPVLTVSREAVSLSGAARTAATVSLVALRSSVAVAIGRGENAGHTIRYTNVVAEERLLGRWTGGSVRFAIPAEALRVRGADRYAVIVQQEKAGSILAASYL